MTSMVRGDHRRKRSQAPPRKTWREFLKVTVEPRGWTSEYKSVDNLLRFLQTKKSDSYSVKMITCITLHNFCLFTGKNPDELVVLDKAALEQSIDKFANDIWNRTHWGKTANTVAGELLTFFRQNGFRDLCIPSLPFHVTPRKRKRAEYIPLLTEAIRMADTCGLGSRDRAIILTLAFTGLRNSTFRALRYCDIKDELEAGKENLLIRVEDSMKQIVPDAAKGRIPYYVFTTKQTTEAIALWIKNREKDGRIPDDSILFCTKYNNMSKAKRGWTVLSSEELQNIVHKAALRAGLKLWKSVTPQALRKTFNSFLMNQPPESRLDSKDQEFFMGHILPGSQDAYYDSTKIEEMRAKFAKLSVDRDPSVQIAKEMACDMGIDPDAARAELVDHLGRQPTISEEVENLRKRIKEKIEVGKAGASYDTRIVDEPELATLLPDNWQPKMVLPSGKIVVVKERTDGTTERETSDLTPADGKQVQASAEEETPKSASASVPKEPEPSRKGRSSGEIAKAILVSPEATDQEIARSLKVPPSSVYTVRKVRGPDRKYSSGRVRTQAELRDLTGNR